MHTAPTEMLWKSGNMCERDYNTYMSLFNNMSHFMKKPNIIVHLDVSPEESFKRIKSRNRGCENGMTLEYLQSLHQAYEEFIADIARVIPVIKVDYSKFRTAEQVITIVLFFCGRCFVLFQCARIFFLLLCCRWQQQLRFSTPRFPTLKQ